MASLLEFDAKNAKGLATDKQLLLSEVERLDLKVQTLQAKAVDSEVELFDLREAAPKARAEIDMLQEQVAQLERELEVRFEEARTVNAKLGEVHGVYDSLVSQLDATQTEQEELHEVVEMLKEELEGKDLLQESLETSQSECDSLRGALQALPVGRQAAAYDGDARAAVRLGVRHAPSQRVGHISALPVVGRESDVIDELPLHSRISIPRAIYAKTSTTGRDGLQCCKFYPELRWMVSPDKRASRVAPTAAAAAAAMDCTRAHRVSDAPTPRPWRPRRRGAP